MLDKDDFLLKKQYFLRWLRSSLIRLFKKVNVSEFCYRKLNEILSLPQIFTKLLYTYKWNKKNAQ